MRLTASLHDSIVVSIPACHAGDRGSIPRRGAFFYFYFGKKSTQIVSNKYLIRILAMRHFVYFRLYSTSLPVWPDVPM